MPLMINGPATPAADQGADLYELSLYIMVGVLIVGFIANLLLRPVAEHHHVRRSKAKSRSTSPAATQLRAEEAPR
jgi:hypothetical protein